MGSNFNVMGSMQLATSTFPNKHLPQWSLGVLALILQVYLQLCELLLCGGQPPVTHQAAHWYLTNKRSGLAKHKHVRRSPSNSVSGTMPFRFPGAM